VEDLRSASESVVRALLIRQKYMSMSSQQFPSATQRFLRQLQTDDDPTTSTNTASPAPTDTPSRTGLYVVQFSVAGPMAWNSLPDFIRDPTSSTDCFRRLLRTYLFARY